MAVAPYRNGLFLGWMPTTSTSAATSQLNAAANWFALSFVADSARTLSLVRAFLSAVAGTLASGNVTCDLYDSTGTSGAPGSAIESGKTQAASMTAAGGYEWTGFTTVLTAGLKYWAVFKNTNGTPASNNPTFRGVALGTPHLLTANAGGRFGWGWATSANSGSTWTTNNNQTGLRVGYSDGSYDGIPVSNAAAAAVGDGVYATRESGLKFTTPAHGVLNVRGLAFFGNSQTGTPTNGLRFGLWTGSTPANQGYTAVIPQAAAWNGASQWTYAYFASPITVQPGTVLRITAATSGADASGNRYNLQEITWDTDVSSTPLLPWDGTAAKTYFDGSNWTDSPLGTSLFPHALLLDTAGEFGSGGSAGMLYLSPMGRV